MTFSIGFCFLPGESKEDFIWAFRCFQELGINPTVIIMDGDQAQKNASEEVFPGAPTLLCIWHVNQCVLAKCKSIVGDETGQHLRLLGVQLFKHLRLSNLISTGLNFKLNTQFLRLSSV